MAPKSDSASVVSSKLFVRGVRGLRQADNGIFPYIVAANLNAVAQMIGEKAADMIKKEHS